jgi:hypothetical protein
MVAADPACPGSRWALVALNPEACQVFTGQ